MEPCVFCMIARGEMSASVVYSDDEFVAFDDIMPQAPVHVLVIPRTHYRDITDGVPADVMGRLCGVVARVAELKGVSASGFRVIVNNGPDSAQTVGHLHVHVLGGARMAHGMVNLDRGARTEG